jgi:hypothetical protein
VFRSTGRPRLLLRCSEASIDLSKPRFAKEPLHIIKCRAVILMLMEHKSNRHDFGDNELEMDNCLWSSIKQVHRNNGMQTKSRVRPGQIPKI